MGIFSRSTVSRPVISSAALSSTPSGAARSLRLRLAAVVLALVAPISAPLAAEELPSFLRQSVFMESIESAPRHPDSASMIATLSGLGGWGLGRMQIDFSLHVVHAAANSPTRTIVQHPGGYYAPDCEPLGSTMPVPTNATIEGQTTLGDITCNHTGADCHLLVVQGDTLFEAYASTAGTGSTLETLCLAVWHLDAIYPDDLRGDHCTSADAAGFPMAPLLFNADEIAASLAQDASGAGDIGHAIRFILPNAYMANDPSLGGVDGRLYVRPATHAGGPSGPVGSVPYGVRLRLKSSFDDTGYSTAAKVILNTMKRYGIVLSDGGNVALTAESDLYTDTSWADLGFGPHVFWDTDGASAVEVTDFEVIDTGERIGETYNCVPNNVQAPVFVDLFETGGLERWSTSVP